MKTRLKEAYECFLNGTIDIISMDKGYNPIWEFYLMPTNTHHLKH